MSRLCTPLRTAAREEDELERLVVEGGEEGKTSSESSKGARREEGERQEEEGRRNAMASDVAGEEGVASEKEN